ncbi:hypothetical protein H5407_02570 [Mitsuaria sp. WAJ17]|uniref:hypothetical protein n=1 Tax=Mitsuaria sp. WAJ17 TaxID=2761452 RepID=UPI001604469D|nr:hypothetical protein [Mitsuaria sp. WAJ17]MBB2484102.1 hypothetical protein [Mitsuaria sp. WAJ17]
MPSLQRRRWLGGLSVSALMTIVLQPAALAQTGTGWLLLGLGTAAERPYRSCALTLRGMPAKGGGKVAQVLHYPSEPGWGGKTWPWRTPQGQGELMLLALPAGDYELEDFELVQQSGDTARVDRSLRPLQVRLRIQAGAIIYAGHYEALDRGAASSKQGPQGVLVLSDRSQTVQAQLAAEDIPALRAGTLRRQLPDPALLRHPQLMHAPGER